MGSSIDFINNSPGGNVDEPVEAMRVGNNLGFELAKRGYDVWMGNTRGNIYSRNHTTLKPEEKAFWDYSWDEFIKFDLPALISHVQKETNRTKVGYIGHSQGTCIMFGLLSSRPEYNDIIEPFIALAPVTTVGYANSPITFFAKRRYLRDLLEYKGGKMLPDYVLRSLARKLCFETTTSSFCENVVLYLAGGVGSTQLNKTRVGIYAASESIGSSTKNMVHWAQGVNTKTFSYFDYGFKGNLMRYRRPTPPEYPLEHITNKNIALFWSLNDGLADPHDVEILKKRLKGELCVMLF